MSSLNSYSSLMWLWTPLHKTTTSCRQMWCWPLLVVLTPAKGTVVDHCCSREKIMLGSWRRSCWAEASSVGPFLTMTQPQIGARSPFTFHGSDLFSQVELYLEFVRAWSSLWVRLDMKNVKHCINALLAGKGWINILSISFSAFLV